MSKLLTKLKDAYIALRGFHTKRHLVIIESDDWGSIRMPSRDVLENLKKLGDKPENDAFLSNDCLENESDLKALFEVLSSVKDSRGNPAVITANFATANPSFDEIDIESGTYSFEPFYKTYDKYYSNNNVLKTIKDGIENKVFIPQLHCREHLNVNRWMMDLRDKKEDTTIAFNHNMIGIAKSFSSDNVFGYMDAFNTVATSNEELDKILEDAANIFESTFGYKSKTFVASCFVWSDAFENSLKKQGFLGIQTGPWQHKSIGADGVYLLKRQLHFTGEKNSNGQIYTVRNCAYEPAYNQNPEECAKECFAQIKNAFKVKKPAIINSHRFNYIGSINPDNSKNNLHWLKNLLQMIVKEYDDVEFITSPELLDLIFQEQK